MKNGLDGFRAGRSRGRSTPATPRTGVGDLRVSFVRLLVGYALVGAMLAATLTAVAPGIASAQQLQAWIVYVADSADPATVAADHGVSPEYVYERVTTGFSASLSARDVARLRRDHRVVDVVADEMITRSPLAASVTATSTQFVTSGIRRIGGLSSPTARIDGVDERIDVDVAVLDGGVDPNHPDLNVVGGYDCAPGHGWNDRDGHGTLVAGFIGAIDNDFGAVGVAPGARIWSIRVATERGFISMSSELCGLEWVAKNATTIEVANLSFAGRGSNTPNCGAKSKGTKPNREHAAICAVVNAGVTVVAAAGNETIDAATQTPAAYSEVIAVSAIADSDGLPGGLGTAPACLPTEVDDRLASFSNYGSPIAVAAPGVCISSTYIGGLYATANGTSFATPLVAGAAALLKATNPSLSPAEIRQRIIDAAQPGPIAGDPDSFPEGVLDISTF